jgi:hypothetical protein
MSGEAKTWGAKTEEEAARRRFGIWALAILVPLLPIWWLWGADLMAAALRPLVGLILIPFGFTGQIEPLAGGGWSVGTKLTQGGAVIHYPLGQDMLRRLLLSVPLTIAFLIAPPRVTRSLRAALVSLVVLSGVFALSLVAVLWGQLAPMLDPSLASATMTITARPDQAPLPGAFAQVALIGRYVALSIAPLLTAILLWATLNPAGLKALVGEIIDPTEAKPDAL